MNQSRTEIQITKGYKRGGKTHGFNEEHDECRPVNWWFQESIDGLVLYVIFYTQACRWLRCTDCNLPSVSSKFHIGHKAIMAQIDYLFGLPEIKRRKNEIKKIILSNNGSVLDEETFPSIALMYVIEKINAGIPHLTTTTIETQIIYINPVKLELLSRSLKKGNPSANIELAIGFEAFDEHIRNKRIQKGLSLKVFESMVERIAPHGYKLKCYFMQKPVAGISNKEAVEDIHNAIDYLQSIASRFSISVNMHLNPTFVGRGTILEQEFNNGTYEPPHLTDVIRAVKHAEGKNISIYVGLYDEGLAVPGGSFIREGDESLIHVLKTFNKTGNFNILPSISLN